jgi:hypothetical protein
MQQQKLPINRKSELTWGSESPKGKSDSINVSDNAVDKTVDKAVDKRSS